MGLIQILLSIAVAFGLSSCMSGDNEPSEKEMRAAVRTKFDQINTNFRELGQKCNRREFRNDPFLAMQCLTLCTVGGGKCSTSIELTKFEKVGCEKAAGQPGYICDYVVGFSSNRPFAQGALNQLTGGSNLGQGRFLLREDEWMFLPQQKQ